ncbi:MAG: sigma factor-like helix-turn-helix DNA-binding protein [Actinomycetota bacterium]
MSAEPPTGEIPVVVVSPRDESNDDASASEFAAFYRRDHARIERALVLALGNLEVGRDATAEGFTRALLKWRRVGSLENPAGWVYRTGLNWARSRWRRRRREVSPEEYLRQQPAHPDDEAALVVDDVLVADLLATLSVDHRAVLIAQFYLGWSEAQIAHALDVAPGTVKSRSARARAELATLLKRSVSEEEQR